MADDRPAVWESTEATTFETAGQTYHIVPGTTFSDGHPVVRARPELFRPFTPDYPWAAPSAEDKSAPRNTSSAATRGARTR
jgi:hypothetical protein